MQNGRVLMPRVFPVSKTNMPVFKCIKMFLYFYTLPCLPLTSVLHSGSSTSQNTGRFSQRSPGSPEGAHAPDGLFRSSGRDTQCDMSYHKAATRHVQNSGVVVTQRCTTQVRNPRYDRRILQLRRVVSQKELCICSVCLHISRSL